MKSGIEFRPSAAERWLSCTASVRVLADLPPDKGSKYADEGSVAHLLLERSMAARKDAQAYVGTTFEEYPEVEVDDEMAMHVNETVRYIERVAAAEPVLYQRGETKLPINLGEGCPGTSGTADYLIVSDTGVLHVLDLKYGRGVKVPAERNPQLLLYGLGAAQMVGEMGFIPRLVKVHICQPRLDWWPSWEYTMDEVATFARSAQSAVLEALSDQAAFRPSESGCRWCQVKATCRARAEWAVTRMAPTMDSPLQGVGTQRVPERQVIKPALLRDTELAILLHDLDHIQRWCNEVKVHCIGVLERSPQQIPGWKLVAGRSSRSWVNQEEAKIQLALSGLDPNQYLVTSVISPAQAEKLAGKKAYRETIEEAVETKPGKPTLAPASDPRKPIAGSVAEAFGISNEEN